MRRCKRISEKLFIQMFANRKQIAIDTNEHKLTESVSEMYKMVEDTAVRWQQSCQTTAGHLHDFKDYLETRAEDLSETASIRNLLMADWSDFRKEPILLLHELRYSVHGLSPVCVSC